MRIIGGQASGRRLASLAGDDTRPTGDRVREALFNIWQIQVPGARFLDAYAGTGAVGLEALSRGATSASFCELSRPALSTLKKNIALVGVGELAEIWPGPVEEAMEVWQERGRQFDLIFCDPPWKRGLSAAVREGLAALLDADGMAVVESRQSDSELVLPGLTRLWSRRYGDTRLSAYGHHS